MSEVSKAVFLSYASQDAEAAKGIADALRKAGIEVWFDRNELRGGDQWDVKIRTQIKTCALFIPIISAGTEARTEGYFRREWKFAVDRTHDMAGTRAFIIPTVIDGTLEASATVPDEFMRYQWMRLVDGQPTPEFLAQVKRLLETPPRATSAQGEAARSVVAGLVEAGPGSTTPATVAPRRTSRLPLLWGVAGVLALAFAAFAWMRKSGATTVAAPPPVAMTTTASEKSIAVLPFKNQSPDPANAFFTDGVQEDVLTNLCNIRELRVVSRTSVEQYRGTTKPVKQIGTELGVAYILEGSVQRAENRVRVTGQLIDARTDGHVWARSYDRDLSDIFAIQAELAKAIAGELQTVLSPREAKLLERRPTESLAAYDLFLRAREMSAPGVSSGISVSNGEQLQEKETLLLAAVKLDPKFAEAWAELAFNHALAFNLNVDRSAARATKARDAIDRASRLAADSPATLHALGFYYQVCENDYPRATGEFEKLARLQPNSRRPWFNLGEVCRRQGRWPEALAHLRKATQLDPADVTSAAVLVLTLNQCRRFEEEVLEFRRILARWPERIGDAVELATLEDLLSGGSNATDALLARLAATGSNQARVLEVRKTRAAERSDFAEFARLDRLQPYFDEDGEARHLQAVFAATVYRASGDLVGTRERLENFPAEIRARLQREPTNARLWQDLGLMEVLLDHPEEALRCARRAVELMEESPDADRAPARIANLAGVYAWTGDKDRAIDEMTRVLQVPSHFSGRILKTNLRYFPLRGDPRFEALINDPKSNAPLF